MTRLDDPFVWRRGSNISGNAAHDAIGFPAHRRCVHQAKSTLATPVLEDTIRILK